MPARPLLVRLGWTLRDYAKRVWDNSAEDNVLFLAGGIAFNLLLAAVPFTLLLITGASLFLNVSPTSTTDEVGGVFRGLFPEGLEDNTSSSAGQIVRDIVTTRGSVSLYSAVGFVWFSTRLFGSLRTVLAEVFDIENERGIIAGKVFDIKITVISSLLIVAYIALSAYLAIGTTRGVETLVRMGLRKDVMGDVEYWLGRALAFLFLLTMFFSLYKFLPVRRTKWRPALIAAIFTSLALEVAKLLFAGLVESLFNPASLYSGTIAAVVVVVVWVYYASLIFIVGGEVGQVYELRRVRRMQREVLHEFD